jgi:glycerol kinase
MTASDHILALDQGTTSTRAMIFNPEGRVVSIAQRALTQLYPKPGWVNHDAREIWQSTFETAREAMTLANVQPRQIAGIGLANQRETLVVWHRDTGEPVSAAIVWQSRQSQPQIEALLSRGMGPTYQRLTGLVPDAYFSASKLAWLLEEQPALRNQAESGDLCAGTVDSWIIWNLTGGRTHITDASNASRTMLFDIVSREWSPQLLADLAIPKPMLPSVVPSSGALAVCDPAVLGEAMPICGIAGDQQAALFGQTCFLPGQAKNTYGTGSFLLMNTGHQPKPSANRLLTTIAWDIDGVVDYALEGAVYVSGAAVAWLRDGLGVIATANDVETLAETVSDAGGVVFVPALTGLGAPHWDSAARGTLIGLTPGTTAAHVARATLEAIAFQTRDVTNAMTADSGIELSSLRVDGGASRNDLLMQIQADLSGVPVVRPRNIETTAVGAAMLAGLGCGLWPSQASLVERWQIEQTFEPAISESEREDRYEEWRRAVDRSLGWET